MNDLLKEAIADAKAVKEVALANAKLALEEAFTPRLQSMLSQKLAEEAEAEEPVEEAEGEEEAPVEEYGFYSEGDDEEPAMEEGEGEEEAPVEEGEGEEEAPVEEAEGEEEAPVEEAEDEEEPMDEELMEIIRQLEEDIDSSEIGGGENKKPSAVASDDSTEDKKEKLVQLVEDEEEDSEEVAEIKEILRALREEEEGEKEEKVEEGEDEEEVDIKEVLRALREEEEEEKVEEAEDEKEKEMAEAKLREAYAVISFLRSKINEVNLLNSKLLFSNKLFRKHSLNEKQKMTVIENFDRASSLREVKLVFATLSESFRTTKVKPIKESFASKPTASTRPSKPILNEGDDMANRLRKLAGLK
jgi:hypothetical protein